MKPILLLSLLVLAACQQKTDLPPAEGKAAATPAAADTWPGKYEGDVMVRISPDHKVVLIAAKADGCTGDIGLADGGLAASQPSDDALRMVLHPPDATDACTFDLKKTGNTVTVSETATCAAYHGATCSFNGTATRVK
jgi:hypothetical protein